MIITSSYKDWKSDIYKTYSISGDRGKSVSYKGECYSKLAPKKDFWKVWYDNIGVLSELENNRYYIEKYWEEVLSKLDPTDVYNELNNSILLCYESSDEFCHRYVVAAWFELFLGVKVSEAKMNGTEIVTVERPSYIKEYLEEIIRENSDMREFNSLKALHLYNRAEKFDNMAILLEAKTKIPQDSYINAASFYRKEAASEEAKYQTDSKKVKKYGERK